jgi:SAM-dependent methyltransferase
MAAGKQPDSVFQGSIPEMYEAYLVPVIFEPYAPDIAARVAARQPASVLELAAGTGVVTRQLAAQLDPSTSITATDLNSPMVDHARSLGVARPVDWQQANAESLPFDDASFDVVVCQFGVMFFDRPKAFAEIHRVLRPGGAFVFNAWDRIETSEFADVLTNALATMFPDDPPQFLRRTPHGYHDVDRIRADIVGAGYDPASEIVTIDARSRAASCDIPAVGYCQGTPLRKEIEARGPGRVIEATDVTSAALAERFGEKDMDGLIRAHVVTALK